MLERLKRMGYTNWQLAVEAFALIVLLWTAGSLLGNWAEIPAKLPTHYNFAGVADGFGGKGTLAWLLAVDVGVWLLMTAAAFLPPNYWNTPVKVTPENAGFVYANARWMVCSSKLIVVSIFAYLLTHTAAGAAALDAWFLPAFLIAEFGSILFFTVRTVRGAKKIAAENNK